MILNLTGSLELVLTHVHSFLQFSDVIFKEKGLLIIHSLLLIIFDFNFICLHFILSILSCHKKWLALLISEIEMTDNFVIGILT